MFESPVPVTNWAELPDVFIGWGGLWGGNTQD